MNSKQLLLTTALVAFTTNVLAEETSGWTFDVALQGSIEKLNANYASVNGFSPSTFIGLNDGTHIGVQYRKKSPNNVDLIGSLKLHGFGENHIFDGQLISPDEEKIKIREAWIGASNKNFQVELGTLKGVNNYMGGPLDDILDNTFLRGAWYIQGWTSHNVNTTKGISYLDKSFLNGELIVELETPGVNSSQYTTNLAYRLSNDEQDTVGGKIGGGDELFVLYRNKPNSDVVRIGTKFDIKRLEVSLMKEVEKINNSSSTSNKNVYGLVYGLTNKLNLILGSIGDSRFGTGYGWDGNVIALGYKPTEGVRIVLGKGDADGFGGPGTTDKLSGVSIEYTYGSIIK